MYYYILPVIIILRANVYTDLQGSLSTRLVRIVQNFSPHTVTVHVQELCKTLHILSQYYMYRNCARLSTYCHSTCTGIVQDSPHTATVYAQELCRTLHILPQYMCRIHTATVHVRELCRTLHILPQYMYRNCAGFSTYWYISICTQPETCCEEHKIQAGVLEEETREERW